MLESFGERAENLLADGFGNAAEPVGIKTDDAAGLNFFLSPADLVCLESISRSSKAPLMLPTVADVGVDGTSALGLLVPLS